MNEQKDSSGKLGQQGKSSKMIKTIENSSEVNKTLWIFGKDNIVIRHLADIQKTLMK
jgi:hypothetical protein